MRLNPSPGRRLLPLIALFLLALAGCATVRPPLAAGPGEEIDTLSSTISLSITGGKQDVSAHGYLIFKRPGRLHLGVLSPFGTSLLELFSEGDNVTCLLPGKLVAYRGEASDVEGGELVGALRLIRWVLEPPPAAAPGSVEVAMEGGGTEKVYFLRNGLVGRKVAAGGDEVTYGDYREVDGVPFPEQIELRDRRGVRIRISFEDPEVNRPVAEEALAPKLDDYTVEPLSSFCGLQ